MAWSGLAWRGAAGSAAGLRVVAQKVVLTPPRARGRSAPLGSAPASVRGRGGGVGPEREGIRSE